MQQEKKAERLGELQRKEDERQLSFLSNLGVDLSKGTRLTIDANP
jgi:hypothetical protein